jgi:hypothetical protein
MKKSITLETASRYARYLRPKIDLEGFRVRIEQELESSSSVIEAARKAAK